MPKRQAMATQRARHRVARPARRFLIATLLLAIPLGTAFGFAAMKPPSPSGPTEVQALAAVSQGSKSHGRADAPTRGSSRWSEPPAATAPGVSRAWERRKIEQPLAAQQQVNPNCTLTVPADPLTAQGLATPYVLAGTGGNGECHEANAGQSAFVEASILDPATGNLSVYRPLVIDRGTRPAARPVVPTLPVGAVVGIWFGFNGTTLTLRGTANSLDQGACVNGLNGSQFGQFAHCNAPAFFAGANAAIAKNQLVIPPLDTGKDGRPCPTVRDFGVVDQDQSDNVTTTYLATADGRTAQSGAGAARLGNATKLTNGSDNGLLDAFIDPALGCHPFTAPDLTNNGAPATSLALNELQAAAHQAQPVALIPPNDPMAQVNGQQSVAKANLYRAGVNQPAVNPATDTAQAYCANLATIGNQRLTADHDLFAGAPSPDPAVPNLFEFLTQRLQGSIQQLGCK